MSDLQCAATVLLVDAARLSSSQPLTDAGDQRVMMVYASTEPGALESAAAVARTLGVPCRELAGVQELSDGESDLQAADRYRRALEEIADVHRGETVLVVSHAGVMALVLPRLATNGGIGGEREPARPGVAELLIDADGWALRA
jgi:broad specificity phosphatase PhoE